MKSKWEFTCKCCHKLVDEQELAEVTCHNEDEMVVLASVKLCFDCYPDEEFECVGMGYEYAEY